MRVLLVEDDPMVGAALVGRLEDDSYAVDWVRRAQPGLDGMLTHDYDVVILDLGLPELDGAGFLARLRARGDDTPVIVVTARAEIESRISGLDLGADHRDATMTNGTVTLDAATHRAWLADGTEVPLSKREFAVVRALLSRPGIILSREELEHRVYGWGNEVESNAIDYLIHRVRSKLGADAVRNVRGVGWMVTKGAP